MAKLFYTTEEIFNRPKYPGKGPTHVHFHFRPARPADLCVTLDPETEEVNVMAGTLGPLTWTPYTMVLHIDRKNSVDTYRNIQASDECVVALPGKDIVDQTWMVELHVPRGINELEVAKLTPFESKWVKPPSIVECPVNFECKVEFCKDYYSHLIVFVRVIGASISEEVLPMSREEVVHWYPTYEVDDIKNEDIKEFGVIERLGVMGELFECPKFPVGPKSGWGGTFQSWMEELKDENYISGDEYEKIIKAHKRYEEIFPQKESEERKRLKKVITYVSRMIAWQEWKDLHNYLRSVDL